VVSRLVGGGQPMFCGGQPFGWWWLTFWLMVVNRCFVVVNRCVCGGQPFDWWWLTFWLMVINRIVCCGQPVV